MRWLAGVVVVLSILGTYYTSMRNPHPDVIAVIISPFVGFVLGLIIFSALRWMLRHIHQLDSQRQSVSNVLYWISNALAVYYLILAVVSHGYLRLAAVLVGVAILCGVIGQGFRRRFLASRAKPAN